MDPLDTAEIGTTGIHVTRLGLGGGPLSGLYSDVAEEQAVATIRRAFELGVRYFDAAPQYGHGKGERLLGQGLSVIGRDEFVLSTKVGKLLKPASGGAPDSAWANIPAFEIAFDFSRDGVLRSLEESLERLGLDRVDMLMIHDAQDHYEQAIQEAYPTLVELRSQGVVGAIAAGLNFCEPLVRFANEGDFDCFLLPGRYTLLDHSGLDELLPLCEKKGISVILGGPYNSGILASDLSPGATYFYREAPSDVLDRARQMKIVCDRYDVPLKAAALQFGLAHPAVVMTIPGARSVAELEDNLAMARHAIPSDLWSELRDQGLISKSAPIPSG